MTRILVAFVLTSILLNPEHWIHTVEHNATVFFFVVALLALDQLAEISRNLEKGNKG